MTMTSSSDTGIIEFSNHDPFVSLYISFYRPFLPQHILYFRGVLHIFRVFRTIL